MIGGPERCVLTYGTFDQFHYGHVCLLRELSQMGTRLIVGVSTQDFAAAKGKPADMSFEQRRDIVEACRFVDRVIPETDWQQKRTDIVNHNVAVFAMGENWAGQFDDLTDLAQVVYVPQQRVMVPQKTPSYSTDRAAILA